MCGHAERPPRKRQALEAGSRAGDGTDDSGDEGLKDRPRLAGRRKSAGVGRLPTGFSFPEVEDGGEEHLEAVELPAALPPTPSLLDLDNGCVT